MHLKPIVHEILQVSQEFYFLNCSMQVSLNVNSRVGWTPQSSKAADSIMRHACLAHRAPPKRSYARIALVPGELKVYIIIYYMRFIYKTNLFIKNIHKEGISIVDNSWTHFDLANSAVLCESLVSNTIKSIHTGQGTKLVFHTLLTKQNR